MIFHQYFCQVDATARELQTPLHIASRLGNTDIVVLLLQASASPNAATRDQYTPLHIAAKVGSIVFIFYFLINFFNYFTFFKIISYPLICGYFLAAILISFIFYGAFFLNIYILSLY